MTRYERIVVLLFLLALLWRLFPTTGHIAALFLLSWLLALSYLGGGYWLFRQRPAPPVLARIVSGIGLGISLLSVVPALDVRLSDEPLYRWLPGASLLLAGGLGVVLILHRRRRGRYAYWPLFWRALVVAIGSGFLAYSSIWFTPYRRVLLAFNRDWPSIRANLLMFDYSQRFEQALAAHDTSAASAYLRQSVANGKRWLGDDSVTKAFRFGGVFNKAYDAYRIAGGTLYARADFTGALPLYRAAYRNLKADDTRHAVEDKPSAYWEEEKAVALENIGLSLAALHRYPASDSAFLQALRITKTFEPKPWHNRLLSELAKSLGKERHFALANYLYRLANRRLAPDTTQSAQASRVSNSLDIGQNLLGQDSATVALRQLAQLPAQPAGSEAELKIGLYESLSYYKLARFAEAKRLLLRLKQQARPPAPQPNGLLLAAGVLLAEVELAQADYAGARTEALLVGTALKQLPHSGTKGDFATLPILAAIDVATGQYQAASQRYDYLLVLPGSAVELSLPEVLAQAAALELAQDRLPAARAHLTTALATAHLATPGAAGLLTTAAYLNYLEGAYAPAAARYRQVLATNQQFGLPASPATATAYNGLGLVALARQQLAGADSLLRKSVAQHETVYTAHHPATAMAYLNYGTLRLRTHELAAAKALFAKAHAIAQDFLPADHDFFGDLALAFGDLAHQRLQVALAHGYYAQALAIYTAKFGADHWKTKLAQHKSSQP